ncbi:cytochrome b/b6 domain-containing protein [Vibrio parahaemolyticus]|uniref:cytochrome b/b6 domain-containing protein n=1 Tax=Vibrio mediterranei TaxID=689 RepID=UPI00406897B2
MKKSEVIFKKFERLWHWGQALLVLLLIVSGLEIHSVISLFGFELSTNLHDIAGFSWVIIVIMIFTWFVSADQWRQFRPSKRGIDAVIRYYLYGIFVGETHPHKVSPQSKFNPLQRIAYLGLLFVLVPLQILSGLAYFFFPELKALGLIQQVDWVAQLHTLVAYLMIAFLIVHLYLITLGEKLTSHLKAMLTGSE